MPVRFSSVDVFLAAASPTLEDCAPVFSGTFNPADVFTGTIGATLSPWTSQLTGLFDDAPNRTGTISRALSNFTSLYIGFYDPVSATGFVQSSLSNFSSFVLGGADTFVVPDIQFTFGVAANYDLSQHYSIPQGEVFSSLSLFSGSLPSGVTLNSAQQRYEYNGTGAVTSVSGIVLSLTTSAVAQSVTSMTLTSGTSGALLPFTFGQAFKESDVPPGQYISADIAAFQADVRNTWPDGSVKFAVLSGRRTFAAPGSGAVQINRTSSIPSGTNISEGDLIAFNPSASIALTGFGTVTLASLLGSPVRSFLGPQMSEFHYRSAVGSDTHLVVFFYVRFYAGNHLEIETCVENGHVSVASPGQKNYTATITINGTSRYSAALNHYHHTRWSMSFWYGTDPQITPTHNGTYLRSTKLVPNYGSPSISEATYNGFTQTNVPFQLADFVTPMANAGFQETIGLLKNVDAAYIVGGDARAYRGVINNAYAAGRYASHYREQSTRRPLLTGSYKTTAYGSNAFVASQGNADNLLPNNSGGGNDTWDVAHHPSTAYLAYLITGRWYFMEESQFLATHNYMCQSQSGRSASPLGMLLNVRAGSATGRGAAWGLRSLAQALCVTPDNDTANRNDLIAHWQDNIDYYASNYVGTNNLGIYLDYVNYNGAGNPRAQSPWQDDFFTMSIGYAKDLKLPVSSASSTQLDNLCQFKYKHRVGLFGGVGGAAWCYLDGAPYSVQISASDTTSSIAAFNASVYADWGIAYVANIGPNASCPTGGTLRGSSGGAPAAAGTGYWGNALPAIAYAVDHAASGASAAWARVSGASNWSSAVVPSFANLPVWYVVPR